VSNVAVTICVASQRVIPKVNVCFIIDPVQKLLDTPLYTDKKANSVSAVLRCR
jgi:hypothetical protein